MSHGHHHHSEDSNLGLAFALNAGFTVIELIGGLLTNSVAILSDALHDLGDSLAIGLAWILSRLGRREATDRYSYGFRRLTLLGALINGLVLIAGSIAVLSEAIPRLWAPEMPHAPGMLGLAILGVAVNGFAVLKMRGGRSQNAKVISWHLMEDVLGWIAVLIVSLVLMVVEWPILDPLLSIGFTLFILANVARTTIQTLHLFLQSVPADASLQETTAALRALPHVSDVHHVHIWSLDGDHHVLTAHLNLTSDTTLNQLKELKQAAHEAIARLGFSHSTLEFEFEDETCRMSLPHTLEHSEPHRVSST